MRTPPSQYEGAFPDQIRVHLRNGDRGTLREAYIRDGVLHGWGWQEGGREQRFAFALAEVEQIETRSSSQSTAIVGLTLFAGWCVGALIADRPCLWPIVSDD